jgi:DNA-directed RNA polymerase specialized sigma subunit
MTVDKDLELWKQWNKTKSSTDLERLVKQLNPLIQSEVNRRAGTLARPLLETQAKILTVKAIKSFDPNRGVKLSTHVINQLQKLSRVNYAHQNAARIPEHSMLQFHSYNIAMEDFRTEQGRDPTTEELADTLKWSPRKIEQYQTQFSRSEFLESKDSPSDMFVPHTHDPRLSYAYASMSPRQQKIFEHSTGYNGAPRLSNTQIMRKLGITQGVLSYEKNKIKQILKPIT